MIGAVQLKARRTAAGEAEIADNLVLYAVEQPGLRRLVGGWQAAVV